MNYSKVNQLHKRAYIYVCLYKQPTYFMLI